MQTHHRIINGDSRKMDAIPDLQAEITRLQKR